MSAIQLSPTQESARNRIEVALRSSPVIVKVKSPGLGIRTGTGISTLLRALSQTIEPSCAFLSIQDAVLCCPDGGGFSSTLKSVLSLALKSLETSDVLIIDDLDLLAMPATIHSNGDSSEEKGHTRPVSSEPVLLLKALCDHALAGGKSIVFNSVDDHVLRFVGTPVVVEIDRFQREDYRFFLSKFAPQPGLLDPSAVWERHPFLSISELRACCVSTGAHAKESSSSSDDGQSLLTTERLLETIGTRLEESHGAVPLDKVERIDLEQMPGMKAPLKVLSTHVIKPFESLMDGSLNNGGGSFSDPKAGILLFGPPGTGKTSIGRYLAHRLQGKMFMVKEISIFRNLEETFRRAEACAPSVIFFDDIDVLLHRSKVAWGGSSSIFRFLLNKMDGLTTPRSKDKRVVIIMTCETPKMLPDALLRSGRIELWVKFETPRGKQRAEILTKYLKDGARRGAPLLGEIGQRKISAVANKCENFSAADLRRIVKDVSNILAAREGAEMAEGEEAKAKAEEALDDAVMDLIKMRDEVESFMKQMYQ